MNNTHHRGRSLSALGVLLVSLAACSHETPPPRAATSPTFASSIDTSAGAGGPAQETGAPAASPMSPAAPAQPDATTQQSAGTGPTPMAAPPGRAAIDSGARGVSNETTLCATLADAGSMSVVEVSGGIGVIVRPTRGQTLKSVRAAADAVRDAVAPNGQLSANPGTPPAPESGSCPLFDAARSGASVDTVDELGGTRILFMSADPDAIPAIRRAVRSYVDSEAARSSE